MTTKRKKDNNYRNGVKANSNKIQKGSDLDNFMNEQLLQVAPASEDHNNTNKNGKIEEKRISDISDTTFMTLNQLKSDHDLAMQLQELEVQSAKESDTDSLLYAHDIIKPPQKQVDIDKVFVPELPQHKVNQHHARFVPLASENDVNVYSPPSMQDSPSRVLSESKFANEGARRWPINEIGDEVKRILNELSDVTEIIRIRYTKPQDDVTYHILPECIKKDLNINELEALILNRIRELCVDSGGSADMVPKGQEPLKQNISRDLKSEESEEAGGKPLSKTNNININSSNNNNHTAEQGQKRSPDQNSTVKENFSQEANPNTYEDWNITRVIEWLTELNLQRYSEDFQKQRINGRNLSNLTDDFLLSEMGVKKYM
eukprot:UN25821